MILREARALLSPLLLPLERLAEQDHGRGAINRAVHRRQPEKPRTGGVNAGSLTRLHLRRCPEAEKCYVARIRKLDVTEQVGQWPTRLTPS